MNWLCALTLCTTLTGIPTVHDGDTIRVQGQSVRLDGVDAEELNEPNGPRATQEMIAIIGASRVTCTSNGQTSYNRIVARCFLPDGVDIGAELIRRGFALDCWHFSRGRYRALEPADARSKLIQKGYCR